MNLTANFQTKPKVDIDTMVKVDIGKNNTTQVDDTIWADAVKNGIKTETIDIQPKSTYDMEEKINKAYDGVVFTKDEWRQLGIDRIPFPLLINFTGKEINSNIPIIPVIGNSNLKVIKEKKNKVICLTRGVIVFRHMYYAGDYSVASAVFNILKDMGYSIDTPKNDFQINGRKFFGCLCEAINLDLVYEESILTFHYEEEHFKNLPEEYYSRSYITGKNTAGITGLCNEYPDININDFLDKILQFLGY